MSIFGEFKKFALKGNAIDMAVGIIIGGAFGTIVNSLVNDIIMPPFGMLIGQVDFSELCIPLSHGADGKVTAAIYYGKFINNVISFLIVSFSIFIVIREMNRIHIPFLSGEEKPEAPTTKECPFCCSTIPIHAVRCPDCTSELPADLPAKEG